jgi:hypothetical protein
MHVVQLVSVLYPTRQLVSVIGLYTGQKVPGLTFFCPTINMELE